MIIVKLEVKSGEGARAGASQAFTDHKLDNAPAVWVERWANDLMGRVAERLVSLEGPGRDCGGDRVLVEARFVPGIGMEATRETLVIFPYTLIARMEEPEVNYTRLIRRMIVEAIRATRPPKEKAPAQ